MKDLGRLCGERSGMADALLVIDVQRALVEELTPERRAAFLGTLAPLLERARGTGVPIVYVRHDGGPDELTAGTPDWEIAGEIAPREGEPIVDKRFGDAFVETNLAEVLAGLEAERIVATGMQTDYCVAATIRGAGERGYPVTLVTDAHATFPSGGRSEEAIREEVHREALARGVRLVGAAELFA